MKNKITFKFVNDNKGEVRLHTFVNGKLCANYCTDVDKDGYRYGYIPTIIDNNVVSEEDDDLSIKNMVMQVREGYGDAIIINNFFVATESVVYYEDRYYGELMRYKTIQGFKDVAFGYCIDIFNVSPFPTIGINNTLCTKRDLHKVLHFSTKEEAIECANEYWDKLQKWYDLHLKTDNEEVKKSLLTDLNMNIHLVCKFSFKMENAMRDNKPFVMNDFFTIKDCIVSM